MPLKFSISPAEMADREKFMVEEDLPDIGKYRDGKPQASAREFELHELFFLLCLHHFGAKPSISNDEILCTACGLAADFFSGDWWKNHKRDREQLSREDENPDLQWVEPFRLSLLFASLQGDELLVRQLADWPQEWMTAEWRAVPFPEGIEQFYFALLRRLGLAGFSVRAEQIKDKRISLLCQAIADAEDEKLAKALNQSLGMFCSRLKPGKILPYEAIAIEETIIVNLWSKTQNVDLLQQIEGVYRAYLLS